MHSCFIFPSRDTGGNCQWIHLSINRTIMMNLQSKQSTHWLKLYSPMQLHANEIRDQEQTVVSSHECHIYSYPLRYKRCWECKYFFLLLLPVHTLPKTVKFETYIIEHTIKSRITCIHCLLFVVGWCRMSAFIKQLSILCHQLEHIKSKSCGLCSIYPSLWYVILQGATHTTQWQLRLKRQLLKGYI